MSVQVQVVVQEELQVADKLRRVVRSEHVLGEPLCQAFAQKQAPRIPSVSQSDIDDLATVSVSSSDPSDLLSGAHRPLQAVSRGEPLLMFVGTVGLADFRRIDIAQLSFYASLPSGIAIDKARPVGQNIIPA
jgi:hypothetical protein